MLAEPALKELRDAFRALADTTRLRLLAELAGGDDVAVCELARALRMSQPLISWHLSILRRAGLIQMRREGRQVRCSLEGAGLARCRAALEALASGRAAASTAGSVVGTVEEIGGFWARLGVEGRR